MVRVKELGGNRKMKIIWLCQYVTMSCSSGNRLRGSNLVIYAVFICIHSCNFLSWQCCTSLQARSIICFLAFLSFDFCFPVIFCVKCSLTVFKIGSSGDTGVWHGHSCFQKKIVGYSPLGMREQARVVKLSFTWTSLLSCSGVRSPSLLLV